MDDDRFIDPNKISNSPYDASSSLGMPPLPERTMPSFQSINPRPFEPVGIPRELTPTTAVPVPTLYLIPGTAANKVQVTPGYVNLEMPTLGTIALDAEIKPEITITGPTEVWLKVVGTFDSPSDTYVATIEPSEASPSITATGFVSSRLLGTVELDDGSAVITHIHQGGDLSVESFGSVNLWWKV